MSADPSIWGPHYWYVLHSTAYQLDESPSEEQQQAFTALLNAYAVLIPCEKCRLHFSKAIAAYPPSFESRTAVFDWTRKLHNKVNERLHKNTLSLRQAEAAILARPPRNGLGGSFSSYYAGAIVILLLIILITLLIWWRTGRHQRRHAESS